MVVLQALYQYYREHEKARDYLRNFVLEVIESQPQAKDLSFCQSQWDCGVHNSELSSGS